MEDIWCCTAVLAEQHHDSRHCCCIPRRQEIPANFSMVTFPIQCLLCSVLCLTSILWLTETSTCVAQSWNSVCLFLYYFKYLLQFPYWSDFYCSTCLFMLIEKLHNLFSGDVNNAVHGLLNFAGISCFSAVKSQQFVKIAIVISTSDLSSLT